MLNACKHHQIREGDAVEYKYEQIEINVGIIGLSGGSCSLLAVGTFPGGAGSPGTDCV